MLLILNLCVTVKSCKKGLNNTLRLLVFLWVWDLNRVFCCCSVAKLCLTLCDPWTAACQAPLPSTISWSLFKFMSIESVMLSNHLILCCPLLLLPSIFPNIRAFSNESTLRIRWPKYWSFSFSISPSSEYSGLISFRIDWLDLLAVQETVKSSPAPQCKSINSSALSFLYGPTLTSVHDYWKNHSFDYMDLCRQGDLSAFKYAAQVCHSFHSKEQASFNFMAAVTVRSDLGAQENKVCHRFPFSPLFSDSFPTDGHPSCFLVPLEVNSTAGVTERWGVLDKLGFCPFHSFIHCFGSHFKPFLEWKNCNKQSNRPSVFVF